MRIKHKIKFYITLINLLAFSYLLNTYAVNQANNDIIQSGDTLITTTRSTPLDVTVTDKVSFVLLAPNTNNATVSSVSVHNNLTTAPVIVSNIVATAADGFTINTFDTDFKSLDANSNNFGIAYTGYGATTSYTQDISGNGYDMDQEIAANDTIVFNLKGKSTVYSEPIAPENNTQIANIVLTIGVKPQPTMQDFQCASLNSGETISLVDEREGGVNSYIVGKTADENCWMLQNLRLGSSIATNGSIMIDATNNTNGIISGTFNLSGKLATGSPFTYSTNNGYTYTNNSSQFTCNDDYGCYYNWMSATAGTGLSSTTTGNAALSICPAGWALPSRDQFIALTSAYNNNANRSMLNAIDANNTTGAVPGITLGGLYRNSGRNNSGSHAYYWTRTASNGQSAFLTAIYGNTVYNNNSFSKYYGLAIRCISVR